MVCLVGFTKQRLMTKFQIKYPQATVQAVQNKIQTNTGSLAKLIKLKIVAKAILPINLDKHDRLINGQTGNINYIEFAQGIV